MADGTCKEGIDGMTATNVNDGYDADDNGMKCYGLAIRELRLQGIRSGKYNPNPDDEEEMEAARVGGFQIVQAECHRRSA